MIYEGGGNEKVLLHVAALKGCKSRSLMGFMQAKTLPIRNPNRHSLNKSDKHVAWMELCTSRIQKLVRAGTSYIGEEYHDQNIVSNL